MSGIDLELKALGDRVFKRYTEQLDSVDAWLAYIQHRGVEPKLYQLILDRLAQISSDELVMDVQSLTEAELNLAVDFAIASCYGTALRCLVRATPPNAALLSAAVALIPKQVLQILPMDVIRLSVTTASPKKESFVLSEFFYSAYLQ